MHAGIIIFQGSRMDDQRCSLPQILPAKSSSSPKKDKSDLCPPRSASFNTCSDIERPKSKDKASQKQVCDLVTVVIFNTRK